MVMAVFALWAQNGMSQPPGGGNGGGSASVTLSMSANGCGQSSGTNVAHSVYTLGGQRLNVDCNLLKDLPQGVYVVNGKKILVK